MAKAGDKAVRRLNLDMPEDVAAWVAYMAGLRDTSKIGYVNDILRRDMEAAPEAVKDAYKAFLAAREAI